MKRAELKALHRLIDSATKLPYCDLQLKRHDGKLMLVELTIRVKPEQLYWLGSVAAEAVKALDKE